MRCKLQVLGVISVLLITTYSSYAQLPEDVFILEGYKFKIEKKELQKVTDGCGEILNRLTLENGSDLIFSETICTSEIGDIRFHTKGYLTVVERYSSPVGWTEFYIFDICKKRLIKTKRVEEGQTNLGWEQFIELTESTRKKYVSQVIDF